MPQTRVGELTLDYEMVGQGPPLLMIAGFRRSRVVWYEPFIDRLAQRFTLLLFDNRGTGRSDKPEDGYSIEAFADDAAGLLQAVGIPSAHVLGFSMGGMIAQRLATRHPRRVRGLVISGSGCGGEKFVKADAEIWELLRLIPNDKMDLKEVAFRQLPAYFTEGFRTAKKDFLGGYFQKLNAVPTPNFAVRGHRKAIETFDGVAEMAAIKAPTLVLTGDSDRLMVPENSDVLARGIPGAELCVLENAAHFFFVEKPEESADVVIRFLSKLEPRPATK